MAFCEECGTRLSPGNRFCENCGTPVPQCNLTEKDTIENASSEKGIILTKTSVLCRQLNATKKDVCMILEEYIQTVKKQNIDYSIVDLDDNNYSADNSNSVKNIIDLLEKIKNTINLKYVFLIGNEKVINFQKWENHAGDSDEFITSDFAYTVLNDESPWNGFSYNFDNALRVGRLPTWEGEHISDFSAYFFNSASAYGKIENVVPYCLSASQWQNETKYEFSKISGNNIYLSPSVTVDSIDYTIQTSSNLLYINLHGSDKTKYWYGQNGSDYPEAVAPITLKNLSQPNIIGVEACYGAYFEDEGTNADRIILAALTNKTIAFLGSSRIAYGKSEPQGSCADIIVSVFSTNIAEGVSAGDSYVNALERLSSDPLNDAGIKTLCEFGIYGDPSTFIGTKRKKTEAGLNSHIMHGLPSAKAKGNHISVPDVRSAVRLSIANVDSKIVAEINRFTYKKYAHMNDVQPRIYSVGNTRLYQALYEDSNKSVVKVYFDFFGNIKQELISK